MKQEGTNIVEVCSVFWDSRNNGGKTHARETFEINGVRATRMILFAISMDGGLSVAGQGP